MFWHQQGYWAKKIEGKLHYFGTRGGSWQDALKEFESQVHLLQLGEPRSVTGVTVKDLCNLFLASKNQFVQSGEFALRSFRDYRRVCKQICKLLGESRDVEKLMPSDFATLRADAAAGVSVTTMLLLMEDSGNGE